MEARKVKAIDETRAALDALGLLET